MSIIPVIDLLGGQVVRAVRGDRLAYKPIESALCRSAQPRVVARVLCEYTASRVLYVADLEALLGRAAQTALVVDLLDELPDDVQLWVDAGFRDRASADAWLAALGPGAARALPVFGSESLASRQAFEECFAAQAPGVLSLDRRHGQALDPSGCRDLPSIAWVRTSGPICRPSPRCASVRRALDWWVPAACAMRPTWTLRARPAPMPGSWPARCTT